MASSENVRNLAVNATEDVKQHYRAVWQLFLESIEQGVPQVFIPKAIGQAMGNAALEGVACRFGMMVIKYDPYSNTYRIGPEEHVPKHNRLVHLKSIPSGVQLRDPRLDAMLPTSVNSIVDFQNMPSTSGSPGQNVTIEKQEKIPKPRNCFIIYRQHKYILVKRAHPDMGTAEMSKVIGQMWSNETSSVKEHFKALALQEKQDLMQQHPAWKCSPRKSSDIKRRMSPGKEQPSFSDLNSSNASQNMADVERSGRLSDLQPLPKLNSNATSKTSSMSETLDPQLFLPGIPYPRRKEWADQLSYNFDDQMEIDWENALRAEREEDAARMHANARAQN